MNAPITDADWALARDTVRRARLSSFHCAVASLNPDGSPHVTPIGSVLLDAHSHTGLYVDVFNVHLARNVAADPRITILAVDSGPIRWGRALVRGHFDRTPAVQLTGTVGPRRRAAPDEAERFRAIVGPLARLRGGRAMWSDLTRVRDLAVSSVRPIRLGTMTSR